MATQDLAYKDKATQYTVVQTAGTTGVPSVGGTSVTITNTAGSTPVVTRASGATVPTDGETGFGVGATFLQTTGAPGATMYVNNGSSTSCAFRAVATSGGVGNTITALGAAQNSTPTAAQLIGGIVTQQSQTAGGTVTTPTGTVLSAAIPGVAVGTTFTTMFANIGNQTLTFTAGASGITVVGTAALPTNKNAILTFVNTAANTWIVYTNISA